MGYAPSMSSELAITKSELKAAIAELRAEVRADMISLESHLTLRLGAMRVATCGLLFTA